MMRPAESNSKSFQPQAEAIVEKLTEVDQLYSTLSTKHSSNYTVEQLMCMGSFDSNKKA